MTEFQQQAHSRCQCWCHDLTDLTADRPSVSGEPRTAEERFRFALNAIRPAIPDTIDAIERAFDEVMAEASTGADTPPPIAVDAWVAGYLAGREDDQWRTDDEIAERAVDAACAVWVDVRAEQQEGEDRG
jgi:hypothetical protein